MLQRARQPSTLPVFKSAETTEQARQTASVRAVAYLASRLADFPETGNQLPAVRDVASQAVTQLELRTRVPRQDLYRAARHGGESQTRKQRCWHCAALSDLYCYRRLVGAFGTQIDYGRNNDNVQRQQVPTNPAKDRGRSNPRPRDIYLKQATRNRNYAGSICDPYNPRHAHNSSVAAGALRKPFSIH